MDVDDSSETEVDPIDLYLCHGKIMVWNSHDVKVLRETHHIVGSLVGGLPRTPRQNTQMGLPMQLMHEEANVLLEYGAARLVGARIHKPTAKDVAKFEEDRRTSFMEQKKLWNTKQAQKKQELAHIIQIGRMSRKQRRAEKAIKKKLKQEAAKAKLQKEEVLKLNSPDQATEGTNKSSHNISQVEETRSTFTQEPTQSEDDRREGILYQPQKEGGILLQCDIAIEPTQSEDDKREGILHQPQKEGGILQRCDIAIEPTQSEDDRREGILQCDVADPDEGQALPQCTGSSTLATNSFTKDIMSCAEPKTPHLEDRSVDNELYHTGSEEKTKVDRTTCTEPSQKQSHPAHRNQRPMVPMDTKGLGEEGLVKEMDSETFVKHDKDKTTQIANHSNDQGCLVQLFTGTPNSTEDHCQIPEWNFPETAHDIMRCRVFQNFWEQGYYITSGSKFGGDFLAYPGDPFLYHSFYVIICLPYKKHISPLDIVAFGRMASNVKKTVVLCSVDETDEVVYTSVQWTGIS